MITPMPTMRPEKNFGIGANRNTLVGIDVEVLEGVQVPSETPRAQGDAAAGDFSDWVRPYWNDMHRLARRLVGPDHSDDVVQEALTSAWRKRSQFDPERGGAQGWLLAIVADQAFKHHRRDRLRAKVELIDSHDLGADPTGQPTAIDLRLCLRQLTHRQQLAIALHYYVGLPIAEVAAVMGCAPGTAKSTLFDARSRLRSLLGEEYA